MSLVIDKEFESLLFPLSSEELNQLRENIVRDGCLEPLVVWGDTLVDGHNRYKICTENTIPFTTVSKEFSDRGEVIEFILRTQLGRRNLSDFHKNEIALRYKDVLAKKAKERQLAGVKSEGGVALASSDAKVSDRSGKTAKQLADIAGTSEASITRTQTILEKGSPEDIKEVRDGKASISGKAKEIKARDKPTEAPKQEEPSPKKPEYTEFQQQFINNSPHILRILKSIDDECRDEMSPKERKAFDRIVTGVKELQEMIGG